LNCWQVLDRLTIKYITLLSTAHGPLDEDREWIVKTPYTTAEV
jgi:hypothetical protein